MTTGYKPVTEFFKKKQIAQNNMWKTVLNMLKKQKIMFFRKFISL